MADRPAQPIAVPNITPTYSRGPHVLTAAEADAAPFQTMSTFYLVS